MGSKLVSEMASDGLNSPAAERGGATVSRCLKDEAISAPCRYLSLLLSLINRALENSDNGNTACTGEGTEKSELQ